jgi:hypothetical protein
MLGVLDLDWGNVVGECYIGVDGLEGGECAMQGRELERAKKIFGQFGLQRCPVRL